MGPQVHQAGKAPHAGHGQIKQDEIDFAILFQLGRNVLQRTGFLDHSIGVLCFERLTQSTPEQGMIIRDDEPIRCRRHVVIPPSTVRLARRFRQSHASQLSCTRSLLDFVA